MLTSVSTLLAQAVRHRTHTLLCSISSHELLEATVAAAEESGHSFIVTIKASHKGQHASLHTLLATAVWRLEHHPMKWAVALDLSIWNATEQRRFLHALENFPALTLITNFQHREIPKGWGSIEALPAIPTTADIISLDRSHAPHAISLPLPSENGRTDPTLVSQVAALHQATSQPLVAQEALLTPQMLTKYLRAGITAVTLDEQLEEAFTAGLRTGLRNRSLSHPEVYLAKGRLAVTNCIINYLHHLN